VTPGARTQAAIELLDQIILAARDQGPAADTLIARYFAIRRYAGSKDRRAVRDLVYAAIRLLGERPASGRAALLALAAADPELASSFDGSPRGPASISEDEPVAVAGIAPAWLVDRLAASGIMGDAIDALVERAPLDIRVNTLRTTRKALAEQIGEAAAIQGVPQGLRLANGYDASPLAGLAEIQDAGSQIVTMAAEAEPGQRIVDLCAGAGGKTLALAAAMRNAGTILAADIDRARLNRLAPRAIKAGVSIIETRLLDPGREAEMLTDWHGKADCVLIDAPCSGTGTWRRNPEARWRLTPERLMRVSRSQEHVLEAGAVLVRPGGALVYIVCSLLDEEGADQVSRFSARHPDWQVEWPVLPAGVPRDPGIRLTPAHDGTDGFFVARLVAPC
jgi:16S rRNA (cytosine967-C5)-methyltransferase